VLQVNDLIVPGAKQIAFPRLRLLWSHRPLRYNHGITAADLREIFKIKFQAFEVSTLQSLQSQDHRQRKNRMPLNGLSAFSRKTI
jgi:hypothetical protein